MSRAPSIRARAAEGSAREASIHFPGATGDERKGGATHSQADVTIRAIRHGFDDRPRLTIRTEDEIELTCSELMALGALANVQASAEHETEAPEGHFTDPASVAHVRDLMKRGNEWAWCVVTVTATWCGFTGRAVLGGCSYEGERDFRRSDFDQMRAEALGDLRDQIAAAGAT